jgi:hypothetical protein
MPEAAQTEFWRDLKPIDNVFGSTRCRSKEHYERVGLGAGMIDALLR